MTRHGTDRVWPTNPKRLRLAAWATLGGKQARVVYGRTPLIYVSSYSLLTVGKQLGVPLLLVIAYLGGVPDLRNSFLYATIVNIYSRARRWNRAPAARERRKNCNQNQDAVRAANSQRGPYAALCCRGVFGMICYECLQLLAGKMTDHLVVTSQSGQRIEWSHLVEA
jgi:hypothetical protein